MVIDDNERDGSTQALTIKASVTSYQNVAIVKKNVNCNE